MMSRRDQHADDRADGQLHRRPPAVDRQDAIVIAIISNEKRSVRT